jgi:hypothetical protein
MMRVPVRTFLLLAVLATSNGAGAGDHPGLIVHEWGTFTSVVDERGLPMMWRPFDEPSDLPRFVYTACASGCDVARVPETNAVKASLRALVRLETPVLYFYAPSPMNVSVHVSFPGGRLTEWYPQAESRPSGLSWPSFAVQPNVRAALPDEAGPRVYYAARDVDAANVAVDGPDGLQNERFLFYRGVGHLMSPVFIGPEPDGFAVLDGRTKAVSDVIVFENRGGRIGYALRTKQGPRLVVARRELAGSVAALRADLVKVLVRNGLYEKEAAAMVATWGDSWFEEGTRVFYLVPAAITDAALPLRLDPRPSSIVRVLVARTEILTTERLASVEAEVRCLTALQMADASVREGVRHRLGRFGEPALRRLLETRPDAELQARIRALLARSTS